MTNPPLAPDDPPVDLRRQSPSFDRNGDVIRDALVHVFAGLSGRALEIGSGSGQHITHFAPALPGLRWIPSEPDPANRASIEAWTRALKAPVETPLSLDASGEWATDLPDAAPSLAAIFSANVVHIAPWAVAEGIFRGAGQALVPGGRLALYGPFREGGRHTGEGNAAFDAQLRAENPAWGIRDVADLEAEAQASRLTLARVLPMPANNRILVFIR